MAYIDVPIEDYLDEVDSDSLIKEIQSRGYVILNKSRLEVKVDNDGKSNQNVDVKRQLCDMVEVGYHSPKSVIIEKIAELL